MTKERYCNARALCLRLLNESNEISKLMRNLKLFGNSRLSCGDKNICVTSNLIPATSGKSDMISIQMKEGIGVTDNLPV